MTHTIYSRKCASEIFQFILCDTDREYNKSSPANHPIVYAMKGNSLSINTARLMIEEVWDVCLSKNAKILTEVCDGQFHNHICRSIDGKPLTWLTWQKRSVE